MAISKAGNAASRENAIILVEEGRRQFAQSDYAAARASFKEAASLDPSFRDVWLCLASVSSGAEQAGYLKRVKQQTRAASAASRGPAIQFRRSHAVVAALVSLLVIALVAVFSLFNVQQPEAPQLPVEADASDYTVIFPNKTGKVNLNGQAGLFVPAGAITKEEKFLLSYPDAAPELPDNTFFASVGQAVQVQTTATTLRKPVWLGFRYDPAQLPAGADENSLQLARWDGTSWEMVDRIHDQEQKILYTKIHNFSSPLYRIVVWSPSAALAGVAKQVAEANQAYYDNEDNTAAAALYEEIVRQVAAPEQLASLPEIDQQSYWMAYNLWGDALYNAGQEEQAGNVYLACIETALASESKFSWDNHLLTGPGYALVALQNRFPLGINLTKALHAEAWASQIPSNLLTLSTESFAWRMDMLADLSALPSVLKQTIEDYESSLGRQPGDAVTTSLDLLVLSPQAQGKNSAEDTINQAVLPFLQSSGIPNIAAAALKDTTTTLRAAFETVINQDQVSNSYLINPVEPGEDRHTHAPLIVLRIERVWLEPTGQMTHSQQIYTLGRLPSSTGVTIGDPISNDATYRVVNNQVEKSTSAYGWSKIGATLTKDITITPNYTEKSLALGSAHACVLTKINSVQCWGWNQSGQLGNGETNDSSVPKDVMLPAGVFNQVVAGDSHTCALASDGRLFCWGNNSSGQVGNGSKNTQLVPAQVTGIAGQIVSVTAGALHTCAVTQDGLAYCWGNNLTGQLGVDTGGASDVPVLVPGLSGVQSIAAGGSHTCALTQTGPVQCWGANASGQLGNNQKDNSPTPVTVSGLEGITAITAGQEHTCALTAAGGVKCWGANAAGQLGSGSSDAEALTPVDVKGLQSGVVDLRTFKNHTCAINEQGVLCWGMNNGGQLGNGSMANQPEPVTAGISGSRFISIGTGNDFSCARTDNGLVYCWGKNEYGQLGNRSTVDNGKPVAVSGYGTVVVDAAGKLEISPAPDGNIELGSTVRLRMPEVPADTKVITYLVSYNGQPFTEIGRTQGADSAGVEWASKGAELNKKVIFKTILENDQAASTEYVSWELTIKDSRKPTVEISIDPPAKVIELGDTITFTAMNAHDAVDDINGSGIKEVIFSVLENGAMFSSPVTVPFTAGQPMQITWPAPLYRKSHNTLVTFRLVVVDHAGNEYTVEDAGYSLADRLRPNFIGGLKVDADGKTVSSEIEMGAKVSVTMNVNDLFNNNRQGSGIREAVFFVSTDGTNYKSFSSQAFQNAPTTQTIPSGSWDSTGTAAGAKVVFKGRVVDVAGNASEKFSDTFNMVDTTPATANTALDVNLPPNSQDLTIKAKGLSDGAGSGVARARFTVKCGEVNVPVPEVPYANADIETSVKLPTPDKSCGWNSTVTVSMELIDKSENKNPNAASGSATYKYDASQPTIVGAVVPGAIENKDAGQNVPVAVTITDNAGGSPVSVKLTVTCNGATLHDTSKPGTNAQTRYDFTWAPQAPTDTCGWDDTVSYTVTVKDEVNAAVTLTPAPTSVYQIDAEAPDLSISPSPFPSAITQPMLITIAASDPEPNRAKGGSGVKSVAMQINGQNQVLMNGEAANTHKFNGPYPCGNLAFNFSAQDQKNTNNLPAMNSSYSYHAAEGSITLTPVSITSFNLVNLSAEVNETCNGIGSASFTISKDGSAGSSVTIDNSDVKIERDGTTGKVKISAAWQPEERIFNNGDLLTIKLTAHDGKGALIGEIQKTGISFNVPAIAITDCAALNLTVNEGSSSPGQLHATTTAGSQITRWYAGSAANGGSVTPQEQKSNSTTYAFSYSPAALPPATDSFLITVENNKKGSATCTVNVAIHRKPLATATSLDLTVNEDTAAGPIDLLPGFSDPDGDLLSYAVQNNSNAELVTSTHISEEGQLTITIAPNKSGSANITVRASDLDGLFVDRVIHVTVTEINDAPTASAIAPISVTGAEVSSSIDLWPAFSDLEDLDGALDYTIQTPLDSTMFTSVDIVGRQNLVLTYAPGADGTVTITIRATDSGGLYVENSVSVTVTPE